MLDRLVQFAADGVERRRVALGAAHDDRAFDRGNRERGQPRGARPRRHLADLQRDRLVLDDRLAEGLADLRVVSGELQRALGELQQAQPTLFDMLTEV